MASGSERPRIVTDGQSVTFHTTLRPGREVEYEQVHASIPDSLERDIRSAGCTSWMIFRSELVLTHVLLTSDIESLFAALDSSSAHAAWQKVISPLLDIAEPLPAVTSHKPGTLVWSLNPLANQ